jgi:hypothetical protein
VTVNTADVAFCDLDLDPCPRVGRHETRDICQLVSSVAVIELEQNRIGLSAVDAYSAFRERLRLRYLPLLRRLRARYRGLFRS